MKVCILTTAFPRWTGDDRGIFIMKAAQTLVKQGVEVRVIAIHSPGAKHFEIMEGFEVIRPGYLPEKLEMLQKEGGGLPEVWRKHPFSRLAIIPFFFAHTWAAIRYSKGFDILHANWTLSGMVALLSQFLHRRPYVVMVHGSDLYQASKMRLVRFATKHVFIRAKSVVVISRDLARIALQLGVPKNKLVIIPEGVDTDQFFPGAENREQIILFVGSWIPRKGVLYLLKAFPKILEACPDSKLVLIGEGYLESEMRQTILSLQVNDKVIFLGNKTQEEVAEWMRKAKVFVLPSLEEGLGVVLLEAISSGTPCVGSEVGGIPDIVTPDVGILVPPRNSDALAEAVIRILTETAEWQARSISSRMRATEHFGWNVVAAQLRKVHLEALESAREEAK